MRSHTVMHSTSHLRRDNTQHNSTAKIRIDCITHHATQDKNKEYINTTRSHLVIDTVSSFVYIRNSQWFTSGSFNLVRIPLSCTVSQKVLFQFRYCSNSDMVYSECTLLHFLWDCHLPFSPLGVSVFNRVIHDSSSLSLLFLLFSLSTIVME